MAASPSSRDHKICIFDLPPKIRTKIYQSILPMGELIEMRRGDKVPDLLAVDRRTRAATTRIYYGSNVFDVRYFSCTQWMRSRQLQSRQSIRFMYVSACPWIFSPKLYDETYVRREIKDMRRQVLELGMSWELKVKFE